MIVKKTKHCSGVGEIAADAMSKDDWHRAYKNMQQKKKTTNIPTKNYKSPND